MAEVDGKSEMVAQGSDVPSLGMNPIFKQIGAMVGIAISVALGFAVVMWTQAPNYSVLDASLSERDAMDVVNALQTNDIQHKIDPTTGMVLVETSKLQEAKMKLASMGLPRSAGMGFELITGEPGFGVSQLVEKARHQRAIEGELARTIATINAVQSARVHLAIPKQSVFIRKRKTPSASVTLKLYAGRKLQEEQVDAIVHMVASSVAELEADNVTVVDQKGKLLSSRGSSREMQMSADQFDYTSKLEDRYRDRVYDILIPIVGDGKVRVQVNADVDFTVTEQTSQRYNPDMPALISEQVNEEASTLGGAIGVPGALTNQPQAAGEAPEIALGTGEEGAGQTVNSSKQATRNYEVDKTISHTRLSPANLQRLSVAVVVDDLISLDADGQVQRRQRTPEEIERISQLVREAIGFDNLRGDTVKVINSAFMTPDPIEALPELPIWEQAWVWDIVKQVGGILVVILLILLVLRPAMKRLTSNEMTVAEGSAAAAGGQGAGGGAVAAAAAGAGGQVASLTDESGAPISLPGPGNYESILEAARRLVDEDPKRVAQLVKSWTKES